MNRNSLFERMTIQVTRPAPSYFEDGEWHYPATATTPFAVKCNVQPFKMNQKRMTVPDGYRIEDCVIVYTQDRVLHTSSVYTSSQADTFTHKGFTYECYQEQDWTGYGLSCDHWVVLAVKKEPPRNVADA